MNSLRVKLTLRLLAGGILLLGATGLLFEWRMRVAVTREFDSALLLTARSLQGFVEEKGRTVAMDGDVDEIQDFNREGGPAVFLLARPDGAEIKRSRSLGNCSLPMPSLADDHPIGMDIRLQDGRKLRCIALRIPVDRDGPAVLVVGRLRKPLEQALEGLGEGLTAACGFCLVALAALVWWGVRSGLAPLERLVAKVAKVDAGSLATRFEVAPLPGELRPIARRLNELLGRLEGVFAKEKRFTANVAHELRTPLAELRALAEVNLMVPPESAAENAACWQDVKEVAGRMEALALRLLELARTEQSAEMLPREPVDFSILLDSIWKRLEPQARARGIALDRQVSDELVLESDPVLLDLIVSNLCGNAVQHAPENTVLQVIADGGAIRFVNEAPDLVQADLERLFERFWKKDSSRTDSRRHGLGLALAAETAALLGGRLRARLTEDRKVEFTLNLA